VSAWLKSKPAFAGLPEVGVVTGVGAREKIRQGGGYGTIDAGGDWNAGNENV